MCGFGGIINSSKNVSRDETFEIARCVSFRGPDSTDVAMFDQQWQAGTIHATTALFFNRLAIIDLNSRSNQPFQDEDHLLIFNGEIYNYKDLKSELTSKGVQFKTTSDTEVLFHALRTWGERALTKLNGMFSFYWMNKKDQSFILARDRVGIKPMYYAVEDNALIFASELDTILRFSKKRQVSSGAVQKYLCLQYVPTPYTIIEGVYKLPPGHYISSSVKALNERKPVKPVEFWNGYDFARTGTTDRNADLEEILADSVRRQLQSDVPLGLFLSSGVDSSLLTAIVNKHFRDADFNFFTVAFEENTNSDESAHARKYLQGFGNDRLRHHELRINPDILISKLNSLYDYYDEPFGDHASLLNWVISAKAREYVTVALSGDGADEMFWGYPRYGQWQQEYQRIYKKVPLLATATKLAGVLPESRIKHTLLDMGNTDPVSIHFNLLRPRLYGFLPPVEKSKDLWCLDGIEQLKGHDDLPSLIDLKAYLADAMLYKVDRASMATSLEVRVPYLDNTVIDYALRLPLQQKSTNAYKYKAPLKSLLSKLAPHYDTHKPKRGFNFPLTDWLHKHWKDQVMSTITKENLEAVGLPARPFLDIVDKFYDRGVRCTNEVWYMFNLLLWHNRFKKNH